MGRDSSDHESGAADIAVPFLLFGGFLLFYATSITHHLTEDSAAYAANALQGGVSRLFHPHHILYTPLLATVLAALNLVAKTITAKILVMQYCNVFLSAMTLPVFYLALRRLRTPQFLSAVLALILGLSNTFSSYSSQIEVYNATMLFLSVGLLGLAQGTRSEVLALSAGFGLAMCFHQTAVFFALVVLTLSWLQPNRKQVLRHLLTGLLPPLAFVGSIYLVVLLARSGWHAGGLRPAEVWRWITSYAQAGAWGHGTLSTDSFRAAAEGFSRAFLGFDAPLWPMAIRHHVTHVLLFSSLCICGVSLLLLAGKTIRAKLPLIVAMVTWFAAGAAFNVWWYASNPEFWVILCLPILTVLGLSGAAASDAGHREWVSAITLMLLFVSLISLSGSNAEWREAARSPNPTMPTWLALRSVLKDSDLVVASGTDRLQWYRLYTSDRDVSLAAINFEVARDIDPNLPQEKFTAQLVAALGNLYIERTRSGARLLIDHWVREGAIPVGRLTGNLSPGLFAKELSQQYDLEALDPQGLIYEVRAKKREAR